MSETQTAGDVYAKISAKADAIEAEMRRIGYWQATPIEPAKMSFKQPFAADTMTFPQWLQFIFLPKLRQMVSTRGETPKESIVGAHAVQALEGDAQADRLAELLSEFDSIFGTPKVYLGSTSGQTGGGRYTGKRFSTTTWLLLWTAVMFALGVLFSGYISLMAPADRMSRYSFTAVDPSSGGYDSIDLQLWAEDADDARCRALMYRDLAPMNDGAMMVDLRNFTYDYKEPPTSRTGTLNVDAVTNWMRRNGASGDASKVTAEAVAVEKLIRELKSDPAGVFKRYRPTASATTTSAPSTLPVRSADQPITFVATNQVEFERKGNFGRKIRYGIPGAVWLVGAVAIAFAGRKRTA